MSDDGQSTVRLWPILVYGFRDLERSLAPVERAGILVLTLGLIGLGIHDALSPLLPLSGRFEAADYAAPMLLWLVMLGAARAAATLPVVSPPALGAMLLAAAGVATAMLAWAGLRLWLLDLQLGSSWAPGVSGSVALAAIPAGFALMAGRLLTRGLAALFPVPSMPSS